jgi:hypothetical protein
MFRIQAYNKRTDHIEIVIVDSMDERMRIINGMRENPDYGLVTFEHNPRGSFYR